MTFIASAPSSLAWGEIACSTISPKKMTREKRGEEGGGGEREG
jgi:hypothetical protein